MSFENYTKKYKMFYVAEGIFMLAWFSYLALFFSFYSEAVFFVDKQAKFLSQLLFLTVYYLDDILKYLFVAFILMTLNLLLVLYVFVINKKVAVPKKEVRYLPSVILLLCIFIAILLTFTLTGIYFLLVFIFSLTISYIIYVATKYLYEDSANVYEDNELIKTSDPFQTKEEAEEYLNNFVLSWEDYFYQRKFQLAPVVKYSDDAKYYVCIYIHTMEDVQKSK